MKTIDKNYLENTLKDYTTKVVLPLVGNGPSVGQFIGTSEEWENLTEEQRVAYSKFSVIITDGTSGSTTPGSGSSSSGVSIDDTTTEAEDKAYSAKHINETYATKEEVNDVRKNAAFHITKADTISLSGIHASSGGCATITKLTEDVYEDISYRIFLNSSTWYKNGSGSIPSGSYYVVQSKNEPTSLAATGQASTIESWNVGGAEIGSASATNFIGFKTITPNMTLRSSVNAPMPLWLVFQAGIPSSTPNSSLYAYTSGSVDIFMIES